MILKTQKKKKKKNRLLTFRDEPFVEKKLKANEKTHLKRELQCF